MLKEVKETLEATVKQLQETQKKVINDKKELEQKLNIESKKSEQVNDQLEEYKSEKEKLKRNLKKIEYEKESLENSYKEMARNYESLISTKNLSILQLESELRNIKQTIISDKLKRDNHQNEADIRLKELQMKLQMKEQELEHNVMYIKQTKEQLTNDYERKIKRLEQSGLVLKDEIKNKEEVWKEEIKECKKKVLELQVELDKVKAGKVEVIEVKNKELENKGKELEEALRMIKECEEMKNNAVDLSRNSIKIVEEDELRREVAKLKEENLKLKKKNIIPSFNSTDLLNLKKSEQKKDSLSELRDDFYKNLPPPDESLLQQKVTLQKFNRMIQ